MDSTPRILTGPPGCGKSHWIQKYAESANKQLFVCPCRKDRTLREGRHKLHVWARRTEPAILWLEGADDLTPEAQAFLRRMLETHAKEVQFILECRDAGRLQEPIRSRCLIHRFSHPSWKELEDYARRICPFLDEKEKEGRVEEIRCYLTKNEYSYRRIRQCIHLIQYVPEEWERTIEHRKREYQERETMSASRLTDYIREAYHPEQLIRPLLISDERWREYGECLEQGGSLWAFLGSALDKHRITPANQEE